MAKKKEENKLDAIEGNVWAAILLAKAEYAEKPTNPIGSLISVLELSLIDIKKIQNGSTTKGN